MSTERSEGKLIEAEVPKIALSPTGVKEFREVLVEMRDRSTHPAEEGALMRALQNLDHYLKFFGERQ